MDETPRRRPEVNICRVASEANLALETLCSTLLSAVGVEACCITVEAPQSVGAAASAWAGGSGLRAEVVDAALAANAESFGQIESGCRGLLSRAAMHHREVTVADEQIVLVSVLLDGVLDAGKALATFAFGDRVEAGERERKLERFVPLVEVGLSSLIGNFLKDIDLASVGRQCAQLRRQVQSDALTGVTNTRAFRDQARERLARAPSTHALILVDIDHFKRANDLYGHAFGDEYLKSLAQALQTSFPADALVGRIGGDEFAILVRLPQPGAAYLSSLLARCRNGVQRSAAYLGRPDLGRVSLGVATYPEQAESFSDLFERADAALYAAKESGRGTTVFYKPQIHARFNKRELDKQFKLAAGQNRIVPYFQPIVDLKTGRCAGFEVLARWIGSDGVVLTPGQFSAIFQDHRTAEMMTGRMLTEGLDNFSRWRRGLPEQEVRDVRLALNMTAFDLMNPEIVFDLQSELAERGLSWSVITLEVTENVILGDCNGQIFRTLVELRARGAKLAMDDFGTGHGGLQHLRDWPIDVLKIDQQFVRRSCESVRDRAVVEAVLAIAHRSGFGVVAEGVEAPEHLAALRALGCPLGQGYLFGRPLSPAEFANSPLYYDVATLREVKDPEPALRFAG